MMQTSSFEEWLSSSTPGSLTLGDFQLHTRKWPTMYESIVRVVTRYRQGVHEYLLIHAVIPMPNNRAPRLVYLRLERNPVQKGIRVLSGKPSQAADTIRMNFNIDALHTSCETRGQLMFNSEDRPLQVLKLKDIIEMYEYLARASSSYSLLGTNCRWLCYGLLECLRDCRRCYGGVWMGCRGENVQKQDAATANHAKTQYLREKHGQCCYERPSSVFGMLMEEAATLGAMATNLADMADQVQSAQPQNATDPNVIYATPEPNTSVAPKTSSASTESSTQQYQESPNSSPPQLPAHDLPVPVHQATIPNNNTSQFSHLPNQQHHHRVPLQSNPHPPHRPVSSVFTHQTFGAHIPGPGPAHPVGLAGHPHHANPNNGGYPRSLPERDGSFCSCDTCLSHASRFNDVPNHRYPQQRQQSYAQDYHGETYYQQPIAEGLQPQHGYPRPHLPIRPTASNTLYDIPEAPHGVAPGDNYNWPPHHDSMYQPAPGSHGYSSYQAPPAPVRQYTNGSISAAYMRGGRDGFVDAPYRDLDSQSVPNGPHSYPQPQPRPQPRPQPTQSYAQPQAQPQPHPQPRPQPTRWFTYDDSGYPPRTESPEPVGQATTDTMRPNDSYQRPGPGGYMTMPDPSYYRQAPM